MRSMIKGGLWRNTEDEILKAAVMKYGQNQWDRISSLLVHKSPAKCKDRWYKWLHPSIKKTEQSREEDEKLVHLAKLMPTQWTTIAPIVGPTPSQCLERYEKLLHAGDDPRKLFDPNPESIPARPDPVDMDEDEKEMLSEARARLANTRGKKAKRKAREKQLEEARRLAYLQKRRELKAAGIDTRQRKRKREGIDYNAEIPFEKKPPPGFYDVADEERPVEQPKFPTTIEKLEGKRSIGVEAQLRNKLNDPETVRKRSKLMLPAPQISDHEFKEIAKMGYACDLAGSGATRAFVANYAQTPLRTPQTSTPAGKADAIMMEAEKLARLRESQKPLLGGENPRIGMTPSRDSLVIRHELHIYQEIDIHGSAKLEQRRLRKNLHLGLSNLPQPKNEYQIVMQPVPEDNEEPEKKIEEDMSDRIVRERVEEEARQQALLRKRSKVVQREFPRPPAASLDLIRNSLMMRADEGKSSIEQADEMIRKELLSLLEHDNTKYPLNEKVIKRKRTENGPTAIVLVIEDFEEDELKDADSLTKEEAQYLGVAMGHENESVDEFVEAHKTCLNDPMYFPTRNAYGLSSVAGNMEKLSALQNEFENVKKKVDDDIHKASSIENKIKVRTYGYEMRDKDALWPKIEETFKQMDTAATELECLQALQKQEQLAASHRINDIWEQVQKQKELERTLQKLYGDLVVELERVQHLIDEVLKKIM